MSALVAGLASITPAGQAPTLTQPAPVAYTLTAQDERFLEDLSKRSYAFFWENAHPITGIVRDRARSDGSPHKQDRRWVGSIASTGFGLTALCTLLATLALLLAGILLALERGHSVDLGLHFRPNGRNRPNGRKKLKDRSGSSDPR